MVLMYLCIKLSTLATFLQVTFLSCMDILKVWQTLQSLAFQHGDMYMETCGKHGSQTHFFCLGHLVNWWTCCTQVFEMMNHNPVYMMQQWFWNQNGVGSWLFVHSATSSRGVGIGRATGARAPLVYSWGARAPIVCRGVRVPHSLQQRVVNLTTSLSVESDNTQLLRTLLERIPGQHSATAYTAQTRTYIWCALFGQFQ